MTDPCTGGGCTLDATACRALGPESKCCPDCTHGWVEPPGQQMLWRPALEATARWWVVQRPDGLRTDRIRNFAMAGAVAVATCRETGCCWLTADDHSTAQLYRTGPDTITIRPLTGWATAVHRIIERTTP